MSKSNGEIYKLRPEFKKLHKELYKKEYFIHSFIYWEEKDSDYNGIMLTTSSDPRFKNILLPKGSFDERFEFRYGKSESKPCSYIAPYYLVKKVNYDHFEMKGKLANIGMDFISSIIPSLACTTWDDVIKK